MCNAHPPTASSLRAVCVQPTHPPAPRRWWHVGANQPCPPKDLRNASRRAASVGDVCRRAPGPAPAAAPAVATALAANVSGERKAGGSACPGGSCPLLPPSVPRPPPLALLTLLTVALQELRDQTTRQVTTRHPLRDGPSRGSHEASHSKESEGQPWSGQRRHCQSARQVSNASP